MLCNMRSKLIPTDHIYIHKSIEMFYLLMCFSTPTCTLKLCLLYKLHNNAKKRFWTLFTENTWHRKDSPLNISGIKHLNPNLAWPVILVKWHIIWFLLCCSTVYKTWSSLLQSNLTSHLRKKVFRALPWPSWMKPVQRRPFLHRKLLSSWCMEKLIWYEQDHAVLRS